MRRLGALSLTAAVTAIVGFAAFYGFVHRPVDGARAVQVLYAAMLLLPPALFLGLALVLLLRRATGSIVLGLVGIAILVGSPTLVLFLGGLLGALLAVFALALVGALATVTFRRAAMSLLDGRFRTS
ncbi:MAG: hypothetical protein ABSB96_10250 [Gaiellaceae bacterium]